MPKYRRVRENGVTFVFKYDDVDPTLLHIFARHMTEVDDALDVFFDPNATETFNSQFQRFERFNATHGLYWFWIDEPGKVLMVITCFTLQGD